MKILSVKTKCSQKQFDLNISHIINEIIIAYNYKEQIERNNET
jgi:hypothetical protein